MKKKIINFIYNSFKQTIIILAVLQIIFLVVGLIAWILNFDVCWQVVLAPIILNFVYFIFSTLILRILEDGSDDKNGFDELE